MINENELRKGNKVLYSGGEITIDAQIIYSLFVDGLMMPEKLEPIPLSPEWLERCGYKKDSIDKKWYKSPHNMPPIYQWKVGAFGMEGLPLGVRSIEFVHQLQNLYFALTGEELTINNEHLVN